VGNDGADSLARQGTTEPSIPERDWLARRQLVESIQPEITSSGAVEIRMQEQYCFVVSPPCKLIQLGVVILQQVELMAVQVEEIG
jgi:hypothetical protein